MAVLELSVIGFRNLCDVGLALPEEGVALLGRNAQGKTSFLEAIYYLETFRSFRRGSDDDLVRLGSGHFRIAADLSGAGQGPSSVSAAFEPATRRKRVTRDGEEASRIGDAIGSVGAVLFTPEDVRLVSDGPGDRRRFLDILLSINRPGYLASLQRYRHALAQRNAALREGEGDAVLRAWESGLVNEGVRVAEARARWISEVARRFGELYARVSGGRSAGMSYAAGIPGAIGATDAQAFEEAFVRALGESRASDLRRRATQVGPHRDEVVFWVESGGAERELRTYGSAGERRTAALVLRLLEAETVRTRRGTDPVLLMDDVFAELDDERSERVRDLMEISARGQLVLTAPRESDLRFGGDRVARWRVEEGRIST